MIYISIAILLLLLSFHYDIQCKRYAISTNGKNFSLNKRKSYWYIFVLVIFVLVSGFRWRLGIDTPNYLDDFYYRYPDFQHFSFKDFPIGADPFYVLINSVVKSLGGRFYMVQIIESTIVNVLIFIYIKKHSSNIFTCLFFYFISCYIDYNMEIMRGALSIVICLYGNDYILKGNWLKGYALYLLALMFHIQTLVIFVLPLLFSIRFNKKGILTLIIAFGLGAIIQTAFGDFLAIFDFGDSIRGKAEMYSESEKFGSQTHNINYFIVYLLPNVLYSLLFLYIYKSNKLKTSLTELEPMLMIGIIFIIVQLNVQIAYRFVDYYRIYFVFACSELFHIILHSNNTKNQAIAKTFVVFLPFFFLTLYPKLGDKVIRYYPYSSIFNREVNYNRELYYSYHSVHSVLNVNEY